MGKKNILKYFLKKTKNWIFFADNTFGIE